MLLVSILLGGLMVGTLVATAGAAAPPGWPPNLRIAGSTTVQPIAELADAPFEALWPGTVVTVAAGGSGFGITEVRADRLDIGMSSRTQTAAEKADLNEYIIARDAVAVIVRAGTEMAWLTNITRAELKTIYEAGAGIATLRWVNVRAGWPDALVVPRARIIGSGTRDAFNTLSGIIPASEVATITATGLARLDHNKGVVADIAAANFQIGYVGLGYIGAPGIRAVKIDGVMPSIATVRDGTYPMSRNLYLLTLRVDPTPNARADDFINYMFSAPGQAHVTAAGFVSVPVVVPMIADFDVNKDGTVSVVDIAPLIANWGTTSTHRGWIRADVNNDGTVSVVDIAPLIANWGRGAPW
ncbi:MAG: Phosphate-binding protein PstS 1 [Firmicutes bacterium]|nr:Phosphate-binding protein PstS 1 [Bacillota bacterium]